MTDFTVFSKALKLSWVKHLCSTDDAPWKAVPKSVDDDRLYLSVNSI